jgi:hypothetical protein
MKSYAVNENPRHQVALRTLKKKQNKASSPKDLGKYWTEHLHFNLQMGDKENVKRVIKALGI